MSGRAGKKFEDVGDVLRYQLMSRRGLLGAGLGMTTAALLGACSGENQQYSGQNNAPAGGEEIGEANIPTPRDKTVIIGGVDFQVFDSFNPMIPNGAQSGNGFDSVVREYMFYLNLVTGELIPWLAEEYEYNEDFTTLTIRLDPKAAWSDGKPLTSKDFKFTLLLKRDNAELLNGGGDLATYIEDVETPDEHTAVLRLSRPNPRIHYVFVCAIVAPVFEILPEHIWRDQDPKEFKDNPPVRSGPYMLDQAIASQKMYVWKRNPKYWNDAEFHPKPEYLIWQSTAKSLDAQSQAFRRAEFDLGSIDEEHAKVLRSESYEHLVTTPFNDPCPRGLWVNNDPSRGIISDPRMHWVISYVLDREKIGQTVWQVPTKPAQYPWADYEGNDKWENAEIAEKYKLEYSPDKAAQLLDDMGAKQNADGQRIWKGEPVSVEVITPSPVDGPEYIIGKLVSDELKKLGIESSIRSLSGSVHSEKRELGDFDVDAEWICNVAFDPNQLYTSLKARYAQPVGKNAAGKNTTRYRNPELDKLSDKLDELDPESPEAKPLLEQALEIYYQTLPCIPVIQTNYPAYCNTTFWTGWPTEDNLYQVPNHWWGQFMFVVGKLEPTGQK